MYSFRFEQFVNSYVILMISQQTRCDYQYLVWHGDKLTVCCARFSSKLIDFGSIWMSITLSRRKMRIKADWNHANVPTERIHSCRHLGTSALRPNATVESACSTHLKKKKDKIITIKWWNVVCWGLVVHTIGAQTHTSFAESFNPINKLVYKMSCDPSWY